MERRALLEQRPAAIGAEWARSICAGMRRDGRTIAGGWPGTIVEARARIASHLRTALDNLRMKALLPEELDRAANATYARAKQDWLEAERQSKLAARQAAR